MNWYLQSGNEADVVLSTRVRLSRNIKNYCFVNRYTKKDALEIVKLLEEKIKDLGYGLKVIKLKDMDSVTIQSLVEKHLINQEFASNKVDIGAIAINDEENICIMINEEDHLKLQILNCGLELENSLNLAIEIDKKLGKLIPYAFNEKYGFLTSCPTDVGTALKASVIVHLPALTKTGNIRKILRVVNNFDMNIKTLGKDGIETKEDLYEVYNKQTLGIYEEEVIKNLKAITDKIIEQERLARKILSQNQIDLEDRVYRAYGILANCKKISLDELNRVLSDVKLGTDLGIIKELNDLKIKKLELYLKPANLQKYVGQVLDEYNSQIKRAEVIKQIIGE